MKTTRFLDRHIIATLASCNRMPQSNCGQPTTVLQRLFQSGETLDKDTDKILRTVARLRGSRMFFIKDWKDRLWLQAIFKLEVICIYKYVMFVDQIFFSMLKTESKCDLSLT